MQVLIKSPFLFWSIDQRMEIRRGKKVFLSQKGWMGLLSHAEPCSPDCRTRNQGWLESRHWRGPQTLHPANQFSGGMARTFMAGKVFIFYSGRKLSFSLYAICGNKSGKGSVQNFSHFCFQLFLNLVYTTQSQAKIDVGAKFLILDNWVIAAHGTDPSPFRLRAGCTPGYRQSVPRRTSVLSMHRATGGKDGSGRTGLHG